MWFLFWNFTVKPKHYFQYIFLYYAVDQTSFFKFMTYSTNFYWMGPLAQHTIYGTLYKQESYAVCSMQLPAIIILCCSTLIMLTELHWMHEVVSLRMYLPLFTWCIDNCSWYVPYIVYMCIFDMYSKSCYKIMSSVSCVYENSIQLGK